MIFKFLVVVAIILIKLFALPKLFDYISSEVNNNGENSTSKNSKNLFNLNRSVIRGMLERVLLTVGILGNVPQVVIAFGALKLGTRIKVDSECKISNDYFLFGNLTSILLALIYSYTLRLS